MVTQYPGFRLGTELATGFTATLTERRGEPVERIPTPGRLMDWLAANDLTVGSCSAAQLELARRVRESIHAAATAAASGDAIPASAASVLNDCGARGRAAAVLTADGRRGWRLGPPARVEDALAVVAADAISIVSGERDGRIALCASPTCRAAFFDTSRSRSRRWCEMNTCGNREKKARFQARSASGSRAGS